MKLQETRDLVRSQAECGAEWFLDIAREAQRESPSGDKIRSYLRQVYAMAHALERGIGPLRPPVAHPDVRRRLVAMRDHTAVRPRTIEGVTAQLRLLLEMAGADAKLVASFLSRVNDAATRRGHTPFSHHIWVTSSAKRALELLDGHSASPVGDDP